MDAQTINPQAALHALLMKLFSVSEFDLFIKQKYDAQLFAESIPVRPESPAEFFDQVIGAMDRRGWLDAALFEALYESRPGRRADIDAVRSTYLEYNQMALPVGAAAHTDRGLVTRAMQIDREKQWRYLVEAHEYRHVLFFLRGSRRQGLRLFLDRMRYDLGRVVQRPQTVISVSAIEHANDVGPQHGVEWLRRAARQVQRRFHTSGQSPLDTIIERARWDDLLLVLGPLKLRTLQTRPGLKKGLLEFIEEELSPLMDAHARMTERAGLRVMLYLWPSESPVDEEKQVFDAIKDAAYAVKAKASRRQLLAVPHIQSLPEAKMPDWEDDIVPFLERQNASQRVCDVARKTYAKLIEPSSGLDFAQFVDLIHQELTVL